MSRSILYTKEDLLEYDVDALRDYGRRLMLEHKLDAFVRSNDLKWGNQAQACSSIFKLYDGADSHHLALHTRLGSRRTTTHASSKSATTSSTTSSTSRPGATSPSATHTRHVDVGPLSPPHPDERASGTKTSNTRTTKEHEEMHEARLSCGPPLPSYTISMSVMVIENGSAISVPMSAVINKTYDREDCREADTPVVGSSLMRGGGFGSPTRSSVASLVEYSAAHEVSMGSGAHLHNNVDDDALLESGIVVGTPMRGGSRRMSLHSVGHESDDEPSPKDPRRSSVGTLHHADAAALVRQAGLRLRLPVDEASRANWLRDISLGPDSLVTNETLRQFHRQHNKALAAGRSNVVSPVSSSAHAIYHYIVRTFAVQNGCEHAPGSVEGFGRTLLSLCDETTNILKSEPRHGQTNSPCYVFGDLHGNFRDLFYFMDNLISFQDLRYTPHRFVFLGDYVDRGEFSVEVIAYIFAMKVLAPEKVLLLRGNHEDSLVCGDIAGYGNTSFRAQCHSVFGPVLGEEVWTRACTTFCYLPLTANIDGKIFCTHGGIPRYDGGVDDRMSVLRDPAFPVMRSFFDVPAQESAMHKRYRTTAMDTCWADPAEAEGRLDEMGFGSNPRGAGVILFGSKAVDDFLSRYGFEYIFRAHQEKSDGLKLSKSARVFTIFSTSAYVGHSNGAGVVLVADGRIRLIVKNADNYEEEEEDDPSSRGDDADHGNYDTESPRRQR